MFSFRNFYLLVLLWGRGEGILIKTGGIDEGQIDEWVNIVKVQLQLI